MRWGPHRELPHANVVLWWLRHGEHEALAELRIIEGSDDELRVIVDGNVRETRRFTADESALLLAVAQKKREELETLGWKKP